VRAAEQKPLAHWASPLQTAPAARPQVPSMHTPPRQTCAAVASVQPLLPLSRPQRESRASQTPDWHMLPAPHASPWAAPQRWFEPQVPEAHWPLAVQAWPLATTTRQVWRASSQKLPVAQSRELAQVAAQVPWLSQMPVRQLLGPTQVAPVVPPHFPSPPQTPAAHWALALQASPTARPVTQAPAWQKVPETQSASAAQLLLQVPAVHATRQVAGLVQVLPSDWPHFPSLPQTPAVHWVSRAQLWPLATWATQAPAAQLRPAPQSASAPQVALHLPAVQAPARHSSPRVQLAPVSAPQRPSAAQRPPRHSAPVLHGVAPGSPHRWSAAEQTPERQSAAEAQAPVMEPHFPSGSQTWLRQASPAAQVAPLGAPQRPSAPQAPPRHWASAVHTPSLGRPQVSSEASQTPPAHTARPTAGVHTPWWWSGSRGSFWPLARRAAQVLVALTQ
jgi:hypothetical protein